MRLVFTRSEDFLAGNPAGGTDIWLKLGARRDGTLTALQARALVDAGAFPEWSPVGLVCLALGGYYRCPNLNILGFDAMTHRAGAGSRRAPHKPPSPSRRRWTTSPAS
jgi:CO/xanthine dehydrogenase Mo-binding subunit